MADKEKRIAIYETESKVIEGNYGDFYNTLLRSEAVERIANTIFSADNVLSLGLGFEELPQYQKRFYLRLAEAALNALLEP